MILRIFPKNTKWRKNHILISLLFSVVTKAVYHDTEAEAPGFEAEALAFGTEAKTEAVDPKTEAARQYVNNNKSHVSSKFNT